jgi:GH18 family chitinase
MIRAVYAIRLAVLAWALPACSVEEPEGEPRDLEAVTTRDVYLRTELSGQYVSAKNAGGSTLAAIGAAPREWERLTVHDLNGGELVSGDAVHLQTYNPAYYLRTLADNLLDAAGTGGTAFTIVRVAGAGPILDGDKIALVAGNGKYVQAVNGGGGAVRATAGAIQAWERFVLSGGKAPPPGGKRVIGYLPNWYGSYSSWATKVDFDKVTHINLAFALGDNNGNLQLAPSNEIKAFVHAAHAKGVKVFPSLCGGGGDGKIVPHYQPGKVDAFVDKIIGFTLAHDMDGIDVDVEAPSKMGAVYDTFIAKLRAKAAVHDLPVTAAVAPWMQHGMSDTTLRSFDWITIMSYDNAGTWTGPGEHSSYKQAVDAIHFYKNRGVASDKIVLGVPFYGYCWGNCDGQAKKYLLYKDILAKFPDAWSKDWITSGNTSYSYNGVATMKAKTDLGESYGGVMIWELAGDVPTSNSRSLLSAIDSSL